MTNASQPIRRRPLGLAEFARTKLGITLRPYQLEAAQAVLASINAGAGRTIVVMFARQSGKDELSAILKAYLLARLAHREVGIVEVNPTEDPQSAQSMARLERRLRDNPATRKSWRKRAGKVRFVGRAQVAFRSGDPEARVLGAVASLLLIVNEAQDVSAAVYDHKFVPMTASTHATKLLLGTAWTSHTLLAREVRAARLEEQRDGIRRVFMYDADDVRALVPAYGAHVDERIARLGRGHPLIRTQYFNEEIDAQVGMFTPARRAMMRCSAPRLQAAGASPGDTSRRESAKGPLEPNAINAPAPTALRASPPNAGGGSWNARDSEPAFGGEREGVRAIVFALDVAGQDEAAFHDPEQQMLRNPGRDAVTLTIASVDLSAMDTLQAPIFRILERHQWTGLNHLDVFARLAALADQRRPQHIIIDATGVGEGLWAMLDKRYPTRVRPVKFSAQKKSEIGYRYLAMIETGRVRDCAEVGIMPTEGIPAPRGAGTHGDAFESFPDAAASGNVGAHHGAPQLGVSRADVDRQYAACIAEVLPGPQKLMRWGVPEGTRDEDGNLIHDDIVLADALLAEADALQWVVHTPTFIIRPVDPLEEMSHFR